MVPGFQCAFDEDTRTLRVNGALDVVAAIELRRQLIGYAVTYRESMTLDLSEVEALSGAAVGVLAAARVELRSHLLFLKMVAAPGSVASRMLPENGMAVFEA